MSELGKVCEHGQLARVCLTCEQGAEIARLHKLLADANRGAQRNAKINQSLAQQVVKLTAQNDALRASIADHNATCEAACRWRKENYPEGCVTCHASRTCPFDYTFYTLPGQEPKP